MDIDWPTSYATITEKHNEAYKTIEIAIKNEEQEQPRLALVNYKLGISLIDDALSTQIAVPDEPSERIDSEWNEACKMIHKMKRTHGEVLQRIGTLSQQYPSDEPASSNLTSSKNLNENGGSSGRPRTYTELTEALRDMEKTEKTNQIDLIFSCNGVKLYHIAATGECTTASEDSVLRIINIAEDVDKNIQSTFFLQIILESQAAAVELPMVQNGLESAAAVGDNNLPVKLSHRISTEQLEKLKSNLIDDDRSWIYPLYPGTAPCFRTTYGAFIFPDLQSTEPGSAYGVIVPSESDDMILQILEAILHDVIIQAGDEKSHGRHRRATTTSDVVSSNIVRGASYISYGLIKSSEKVGEFVSNSTPYLMSKLGRAPNDTPPVPSALRNSVEIAKSATGVAANVGSYVAGKVGSATMALGRFLAPHVQTQGSRLLTNTMGYSQEEASEKVT